MRSARGRKGSRWNRRGWSVELGWVGSIHTKIAVLRAQARGYRDLDSFELDISRCGSLPDNPWTEIVL